jgi:hypothetical protein
VQRLSLSKGPGFHYIIPSFFKTIETLEARGQSFSIVFRTFGDDLPDVMEAVADFCAGKVLSVDSAAGQFDHASFWHSLIWN